MREESYMRRLSQLALAVAAAAALLAPARASSAQSRAEQDGANGGSAAAEATGAEAEARSLYEEAANYARLKFEEFARTGVPYDEALKERTLREQRELASKNAARLAARGALRGQELYYLGMLYSLSDKAESALDAMRRFLVASPSGAPAQNARAIFVMQAAKSNLLDEAERVLADFARAEPQKPLDRYRLESVLTNAFYKAGKYEQSAAHSREAFGAGLKLGDGQSLDQRQRDQMLYGAGAALADSLRRLNRRGEAVAAVQEMRRVAVWLPSARLYGDATMTLLDYGGPLESLPTSPPNAGAGGVAAAPAVARPAPDIRVTEWIDQPPVKLADLRGRVVLLDFWATWCGPCRVTIPKLNALHRKYKERGLVIIGLTKYEGEAEGRELTPAQELQYLRQFKRRHGITYGFGVADHDENGRSYGVAAIPTAVLIDRRGVVRFITVSASDLESKALASMIEKLIQEQ